MSAQSGPFRSGGLTFEVLPAEGGSSSAAMTSFGSSLID
jgi:hypothetical protein